MDLEDLHCLGIKELRQRRRRWQRGHQKSNRFRLAKQQQSKPITLFSTFPCPHCTTTTWNFLYRVLWRTWTKDKDLTSLLSELRHSHLEFNFRKIRQHLTNWMRWNSSDKCFLLKGRVTRFIIYQNAVFLPRHAVSSMQVIMLSRNQSAHSPGSHLINLGPNICKLINHGIKPSGQ